MANEQLVSRRIETARQRLRAARLLYQEGFNNDALSKSYYAIFAAATALMAIKGLYSKKHSGVISLFNKNFVKPGLIEHEFGKILAKAQDARELSDYGDFFEAGNEETSAQIESANRFINMATDYLQRIGYNIA